jgi:hypothetical protein
MPSKGFSFIGHVILALLIAVVARFMLPTVSASLSKLRESREQAYVASMKTDLVQLVTAEEDYFRDSLKYTRAVRCTTPPTRGVLNFCPSRGNVLQGPELASSDAGPGWRATMTNIALPNVTCAIFVNAGAPYPALIEGTAVCRRPGWSGRAEDTTGQIK